MFYPVIFQLHFTHFAYKCTHAYKIWYLHINTNTRIQNQIHECKIRHTHVKSIVHIQNHIRACKSNKLERLRENMKKIQTSNVRLLHYCHMGGITLYLSTKYSKDTILLSLEKYYGIFLFVYSVTRFCNFYSQPGELEHTQLL